MCPFCYIGKRHYEAALAQFPHAANISTEWHSFQLDPTNSVPEGEQMSVYDYLAKRKHITREASVKMHAQVAEMAKTPDWITTSIKPSSPIPYAPIS